jgi:tetratricopeptide (TPR) repeat protein
VIINPPTALPPALLDDEQMQRALAGRDFGTVFRLARSRAGISYSAIAMECDIKPDRVGTLARGTGRITTFDKIVQIADALRIPGQMLGLAPRPWEVTAPPVHDPSTANGTAVRRRTVLQAATTGLAAALSSLHGPTAPSRITPGYVHGLRERTARLRRLDDILGGGDTYRVYLGEYQATKALLRESFAPNSRTALLSLLAEQAQQAGWAAFDGGRHTEAESLYEESRAVAAEAGDGDLLGNSLCFLAYQTTDPQTATTIAVRSVEAITPATPSGVRALLHERLAWACATAGQSVPAQRALEDARRALDTRQDDEPQPDWAAWVDSTELDIMTGRCWAELRRPLRAVPVLEDALSRYDDTHARDKALYLSWLGHAYLAADEIEEAARVTGRALDLSAGVASVRPRRRLTPLVKQLRKHQDVPGVKDVLAKAAA